MATEWVITNAAERVELSGGTNPEYSVLPVGGGGLMGTGQERGGLLH
jgi:hypothetical protein